jgi:hypothetical protein
LRNTAKHGKKVPDFRVVERFRREKNEPGLYAFKEQEKKENDLPSVEE